MSSSSQRNWGGVLICLVATIIACYQAWLVIDDPVFSGDAGYRVFFAHRPVVKLGNRIWLPFLQLHIWLYHLLGLPVYGVKLISVFYSWVGMVCLGFYWRRLLRGSLGWTVLTLFAVVCFAAHELNVDTRPLMQEPIGLALFFGFLLAASSGAAFFPLALFLAATLLMTRDNYWIYLFAATLVGLRSIFADRRTLFAYAALWSVPILWLAAVVPAIYLVVFGTMPSFPLEWPLMYNPVPPGTNELTSAQSMWVGLVNGRVLPMAVAAVAAIAALAFWAKSKFVRLFDFSPFSRTMIRTVPVALAIVYGLVWLLDPWQVTPGHVRVGWPLLELSLALAPLLIHAAASAPRTVQRVVVAAVVVGLAGGVHPAIPQGRPEANARTHAEHERLTQALSSAYPNADASICTVARLSWDVFRDLDAPLFHLQKTYVSLSDELPNHCDVVIAEEGRDIEPPASYRQLLSVTLPVHTWTVYSRQ